MSESALSLPARSLTDKQLHHLLLALETSHPELSYVAALELVQNGLTAVGPHATVYECVSAAGIDMVTLEADLAVQSRLSQAQADLTARAERATRTLDVAGAGNSQAAAVQIDDRTYSDVRSQHPQPSWTRLRRAQRLEGGALYEGPEGERRWADTDLTHCLAGEDILATRERDEGRSRVQNVVRQQSAELERAVSSARNSSERQLLLDRALTTANRTLDAALDGGDMPEYEPPVESPRGIRHGPLYPATRGGQLRELGDA